MFSLSQFVFKVGVFFRNKNLFKYENELISLDFASRDDILRIQKEKLDNLLRHAVTNSDFYRENKRDSIDPYHWLTHFSIIEKKDLLTQQDRISNKVVGQRHFTAETSGTSGEALVFTKNEDWDSLNRASSNRGYSWYDVRNFERNGVFWGYSFSPAQRFKTRILDFLQNRFRLFSYDESSVDRFLKKLRKASYLHGYSSMIYEVACIGERLGYKPTDFPKMKMVKGTSEKIYPFYNEVVKRVFGHAIVSEYGAAETGIIAFECPKGYMHINEENVIVEELNGEIVVTNLNSYSFPIIRYRLGDSVKLAPHSVCSCGRNSNVILEIEGRVGKSILGKQGKYPSLTLYYIFKNLALQHDMKLQYQAYQSKKGYLEIKIPDRLTTEQELYVLKEAQSYFKEDVEVTVKQNETIHSKTGKLKDFITELE